MSTPCACKDINDARIAPGWGCCLCRTYNGEQRAACKHCGHTRGEIVLTPEERAAQPSCGVVYSGPSKLRMHGEVCRLPASHADASNHWRRRKHRSGEIAWYDAQQKQEKSFNEDWGLLMKRIYVASRLRAWGTARHAYHGLFVGSTTPTNESPCGCFACNQQRARALCLRVALAGHAPYAPHLFCTQFLNDNLAQERQAGIDIGIAFLKTCDELWVDDRYGISTGMKDKIEIAQVGFAWSDLNLHRWKTIPVKTFKEALGEA